LQLRELSSSARQELYDPGHDIYLAEAGGAESTLPTAVAGGHLFSQVSLGLDHSCGVTLDKQVYCWGRNSEGELGDGSTDNRSIPVLVAGARRFVAVDAGSLQFRQVSAGGFHSCGVTTGDAVYCWGFNGLGQLGDGTTAGRLRPRLIAKRTTWNQVTTGYEHTCALTLGQRAWCWGNNGQGRLGEGTTTNRLKPVLVGEGMPFRQVTAGGQHSCGVSRLRPGYCWGSNGIGQVGVVVHRAYLSPTRISDLN
jgi:alpha-tubulin suppressor-like RCC1 family protein